MSNNGLINTLNRLEDKLDKLTEDTTDNTVNIAVLLDRSNNERRKNLIGSGIISTITVTIGTVIVKYLELYK